MNKINLLIILAAVSAGLPDALANPPPPSLPDAGASALLLGIGATGLVVARRFFRK